MKTKDPILIPDFDTRRVFIIKGEDDHFIIELEDDLVEKINRTGSVVMWRFFKGNIQSFDFTVVNLDENKFIVDGSLVFSQDYPINEPFNLYEKFKEMKSENAIQKITRKEIW